MAPQANRFPPPFLRGSGVNSPSLTLYSQSISCSFCLRHSIYLNRFGTNNKKIATKWFSLPQNLPPIVKSFWFNLTVFDIDRKMQSRVSQKKNLETDLRPFFLGYNIKPEVRKSKNKFFKAILSSRAHLKSPNFRLKWPQLSFY